MEKIDKFSFRCGAIGAFCEMVQAGVKRLAFSPASTTREERDRYEETVTLLCGQYRISRYPEDTLLITDLFPLSACKDRYLYILYRKEADLSAYLSLKERKRKQMEQGLYCGEARREIAMQMGQLLSYSNEAILRMINENKEKEDHASSHNVSPL